MLSARTVSIWHKSWIPTVRKDKNRRAHLVPVSGAGATMHEMVPWKLHSGAPRGSCFGNGGEGGCLLQMFPWQRSPQTVVTPSSGYPGQHSSQVAVTPDSSHPGPPSAWAAVSPDSSHPGQRSPWAAVTPDSNQPSSGHSGQRSPQTADPHCPAPSTQATVAQLGAPLCVVACGIFDL